MELTLVNVEKLCAWMLHSSTKPLHARPYPGGLAHFFEPDWINVRSITAGVFARTWCGSFGVM